MPKTKKILYEINSLTYLNKYSQASRHKIKDLNYKKIAKLADQGVNYIWFMGVWQRSNYSRKLLLQNETFLNYLKKDILHDFSYRDLAGSAYAISDYRLNPIIGDEADFLELKQRFNDLGIKIYLDFVPNHTGIEHPWVKCNPEMYITTTKEKYLDQPNDFIKFAGSYMALGKDPEFTPWNDVVQLNALSSDYRYHAITTLKRIAKIADGVRCDMAMLLLNRIFKSTWANYLNNTSLETEFWQEVISAVKSEFPDFEFLAEAYWDTEAELINLGFDYCYNKPFLDDLKTYDPSKIRNLLNYKSSLLANLTNFLENHDEERSAFIFPKDKLTITNYLTAFLPGQYLMYDGQIEASPKRVPVHVAREAKVKIDHDVLAFFNDLFNKLQLVNFNNDQFEIINSDLDNCLIGYKWYNNNYSLTIVANYSDNYVDYRQQLALRKLNKIFNPCLNQELDLNSNDLNYNIAPWQLILIYLRD